MARANHQWSSRCSRLACAGAIAMAVASAAAQTKSSDWHLVRIDGDLDTAKCAADLAARLEELDRKSPFLIVLELRGNRGRTDVAWSIARAIRGCEAPITVLLADPDDRQVGVPQLTVGLIADHCCIAEETRVKGIDDPSLEKLAPDDAPWVAIREEMVDWLKRGLESRKAPAEVSEALVRPSRPLWVTLASPAAVVTVSPGAGTPHAPLVSRAPGGALLFGADASTLQRLSIADHLLPSATRAARQAGATGLPRTQTIVSADLDQAAKRVDQLFQTCDDLLTQAAKALDLPDPEERSVAPSRYRSAAQSAAKLLDNAGVAIADVEKALAEYPELLRRPAPGQAEVATKSAAYTTRWRALVQTRRTDLLDLAAKARGFADVRD